MTILTALKKIDTLSISELKHCIQIMDEKLKNYEIAIHNYSSYKMERYGIPYRQHLMEQRQQFINKL